MRSRRYGVQLALFNNPVLLTTSQSNMSPRYNEKPAVGERSTLKRTRDLGEF